LFRQSEDFYLHLYLQTKFIMKKLLYTALFVFASYTGFSQDAASLKTGAQTLIDKTVAKDYNALLDMTYPKLFTLAPREAVLESLKSTFDGNQGFKIVMLPTAPNFVFGEIKKIGNQSFAVINHNNSLQVIWDEPIPAAEVENYVGLFKTNMQTQDVTYDAAKKTMNIKAKAKMVAVADETTKNKWTYLTYSDQMFTVLFDESIKTQLGL
jgi:hypothetical protein